MPVYAFTIALSAFLLFLVQPIVARQILPWFGGSAAVWTTCMMFFQVALLAGYAYSDLIVRRLHASRQRLVHGALLLASLAFLPIVLGDAWRPASPDAPVLQIVWLLLATIGLPYFMLSTTGPLLQAWFARRYPNARVYRLYALSNAASMTALIAYPPLIEPAASVPVQAVAWSAGYCLFAATGLFLLWRVASHRGSVDGAAQPTRAGSPVGKGGATDRVVTVDSAVCKAKAPTGREQLPWFGYSALSSVLLLAVTAHLTQNVASVPFLWLLPLTLYLLTFILCFEGRGWYRANLFRVLAGLAGMLMAAGLIAHVGPGGRIVLGPMPMVQGIVLYGAGFFVLCMFLHGELAVRRPPPVALTRFYLMLALGGAAGGVFVAVIAGLLFEAYLELPLALAVASLIVLFTASSERGRFVAMLGLAATLTCVAPLVYFSSMGQLETSRNFYGVLAVRQIDGDSPGQSRLRLSHGNTVHGEQYLATALRSRPLSYYGSASGVGRTVEWLQTHVAGPQRVGVVGLGTGTLAAFGRNGDTYRFYEIDPMVAVFAERHFTFLGDSPAKTEIVLGDGRLLLDREPPNDYRLLVVDAFSSDAIPMHLLTAEAMKTYVRHVATGGAVAINVSNRYLDLRPIVRHLADAVGWRAIVVHDQTKGDDRALMTSLWVIATGNDLLVEELVSAGGLEAPRDPRVAPWTDAYGNLFDVLAAWR